MTDVPQPALRTLCWLPLSDNPFHLPASHSNEIRLHIQRELMAPWRSQPNAACIKVRSIICALAGTSAVAEPVIDQQG